MPLERVWGYFTLLVWLESLFFSKNNAKTIEFKVFALVAWSPNLRMRSSAVRAPVLHTGGHRFESFRVHVSAGVVQLVRAPPCQGGSCGFEPRLSREIDSRI